MKKSFQAVPPARAAALAVLGKTLPAKGRGADVQAALAAEPLAESLDSRDQALCTELCYGYLRLKGRIDYILSIFLAKPEKVPPWGALVLGVAAYEILFLDKVPARASVNWAVEAVGKRFGRAVAGMANAVLRRTADFAPDVEDKAFYGSDGCGRTTYWSRWYSCPEWIVDLWRDGYGDEACERCLLDQATPPPLGVRINFRRPNAAERFWDLAELEGCCFAEPPMLAYDALPKEVELAALLGRGLASRQSAAAGAALAALDPAAWPGPIHDACAGRGGKTAWLLERADAPVWASDMHLGRLKALRNELRRLELPSIPVFRAGAVRPPLKTRPGAVLLDAPCSGLGVLARRPDTKWKRTPLDLENLAAVQAKILDAAYESLRPGGLLAYITCTLNPAENERRIEALLADRPDAVLRRTTETDPDAELGEYFFAALVEKGKRGMPPAA